VVRRLLVVFGRRTADEILSTAKLAYGDYFDNLITHYFDDSAPKELQLSDVPVDFDERYFCVGVVDYQLRVIIENSAISHGLIPFTIMHPTAVVDKTARIGAGCFIGPLAVVSIGANIGDHSILHIHCSVGHDSIIGRHCAVLPGARISGDVTLGDGVLIGSNAFVYQGSRVGDYTQVDALTYVRGEILPRQIVSLRYPHPVNRVTLPNVLRQDGLKPSP